MEFKVTFKTEQGLSALYMPTRYGGIDLLDMAREVTGCEKLHSKLVSGIVHGERYPNDAILEESDARASGLFRITRGIIVKTPVRFLNQFARVKAIVRKDAENGEIQEVSWEYVLDRKAVVDAWRDAGYPKNWNIE